MPRLLTISSLGMFGLSAVFLIRPDTRTIMKRALVEAINELGVGGRFRVFGSIYFIQGPLVRLVSKN